MANPNQTPDFIEIETDNFVSPNAASDVPDDDFIPLDMDTPVMEAATETSAMPEETPVADTNMLGIATAVVAGDVAGSLASGTMRGVGFSDAAGYVTALANGVKAATAESYKQTLRQWMTQADIDALPVTLIPEGTTLAVDTNPTVITHEGPNAFQQRRIDAGLAPNARMVAHPVHTQATAPVAPTTAPLLTPGTLIAGLVADGRGIVVSPGRADRRHTLRGATEITVGLGEQFAHLAPRIKTNRAQFGETMRMLNASGFKAWAITRNDVKKAGQDWPQDLVARWCVGQLDGSASLESLGEKVLVADLLRSDEIRFTGGSDTLRQKVVDAFVTRIGERTFNATDMLNWFRATLASEFYAVTWGGFAYIPGNAEQTATVRAFIGAVRGLLGRSVAVGEVTSDEGLRKGLGEGLLDEVSEILEAFDLAQEKARERDRAKCERGLKQAGIPTDSDTAVQQMDLAAKRAVVLPEAAGTFVRRLNDTADRIAGYAVMLGDDSVKEAKELLAFLRATIEPLCDSTSLMGANIELD